jgi:hypothetical protein
MLKLYEYFKIVWDLRRENRYLYEAAIFHMPGHDFFLCLEFVKYFILL